MAATKTASRKAASSGAEKQSERSSRTRSNSKPDPATQRPADAIKLLKADHKEVKTWFKEYEKLEAKAEKQALADKICLALTVHAQIEEEIFYPAARPAIDDDECRYC